MRTKAETKFHQMVMYSWIKNLLKCQLRIELVILAVAKPIKINDIPTDPTKILEHIYIQRTQIVAQSATFQVLNVN